MSDTEKQLPAPASQKPPAQFAPAILEFQPDAVELEERPVPVAARVTLYTILAFIVLAVLWAGFTEVERIVVAPGQVVTTTPQIVVQPLTTAIVKSIEVKVGDAVKKNQPVARLDPTFARADVQRLQRQLSSLEAQRQRLAAEALGKDFMPNGDDGDATATDLHKQREIFMRRRQEYQARIVAFDQRRERLKAETRQLVGQRKQMTRQLGVAQDIEEMRSELFERQTGSRLRLLEARQNRMEIAMNVSRLKDQAVTQSHELGEVEADKLAYISETEREIADELVRVGREHGRIKDELTKARRLESLDVMRAPADAVVLAVADRSVGSVIREAEPLVTLVPLNVPLEAEINIPARDIGRVATGDSVRVKLDAYPFQKYGTLQGSLRTISENSFQNDAEGAPVEPVYRGRVIFTSRKLKENVPNFRLIPGMVVQGEIKAGTRSILSYLLYPALRLFDESLREP